MAGMPMNLKAPAKPVALAPKKKGKQKSASSKKPAPAAKPNPFADMKKSIASLK